MGSSAISGQSPQLGNGGASSKYPCEFAVIRCEEFAQPAREESWSLSEYQKGTPLWQLNLKLYRTMGR
jgi:hypothetical protein